MTATSQDRRRGSLESRWRQVLETAVDGYLAVDGDGVVVDCNPAATRLFGQPSQELLGQRATALVPASERRRLTDHLEAAVERAGGRASAALCMDLQEDAGALCAELAVWGVDRRDGVQVHCFVRDITERRRSEQAAALLAAVVEGSADAIIAADPQGRILAWNASAERIYGWSAEQAVGRTSDLFLPHQQAAEHVALIRDVLAGAPVRTTESDHITRGGVRIPVMVRMSPVRDAAGRVVAVSTVSRDMTEQRWMAQTLDSTLSQLQLALAEARTAEENSRRFLADAAHQLRTPLAGVQACAELLLRGAQEEDRDRLLATMVRETSRSARLITGLLRIARLDQGEALPHGDVDVVAVCQDEVERLSLLAPDLEVVLEPTAGPVVVLPLDASSCHEIVSNLGDNARRYARSRIVVRVEQWDGQVHVRVLDDGPGVADDARERIFERFVSLDRRGGSGLGLPIARGLARALGGDLRYEDGFVLSVPAGASTTPSD